MRGRRTPAEILMVVNAGGGVKLSLKDYSVAEVQTLVRNMQRDTIFIIADAAEVPGASLVSIAQNARGKIIFDYS